MNGDFLIMLGGSNVSEGVNRDRKVFTLGIVEGRPGIIREKVSPVSNGRFCPGKSGGQDQQSTKNQCVVFHGWSKQIGLSKNLSHRSGLARTSHHGQVRRRIGRRPRHRARADRA